MENSSAQLFKPAQYTEHLLLTAILSGEYPPGSVLPGERDLAQKLGVTRPTVRETLHRLAAEGWICIRHGKATSVNDYWKQGGLRLLSTMARYGQFLPPDFIIHLLELRVVLLPAMAAKACTRGPEAILRHLEHTGDLKECPEAFAQFDWQLQTLMAELSGNVTFPMILNDFNALFKLLGTTYFTMENSRAASRTYYRQLARAVDQGPASVERETRAAMQESIDIWKALNFPQRG